MLKKSASALKRATGTPGMTGALRSSKFMVRSSENLELLTSNPCSSRQSPLAIARFLNEP